MSSISPISSNVRAMAHYLDQPQVINGVAKFVNPTGLLAFLALIAIVDQMRAEKGQRLDVALRDTFVLGTTGLATYFGLKHIAHPPHPIETLTPEMDELAKRYPSIKHLINRVDPHLKIDHHHGPGCSHGHSHGKGHGHSHGTKAAAEKHIHPKARGKLTRGEIKHVIDTVYKENKNTLKKGVREADVHLAKLFPLDDHDHGQALMKLLQRPKRFLQRLFQGRLSKDPARRAKQFKTIFPRWKHMKALPKDHLFKFFGWGAAIVGAGLLGGMAYDYIKGIREKEAKEIKIKEGLFQFIANIAMCAVGATIGIFVSDELLQLKAKAAENAKHALKYRAGRFGVILAGLSLGIVGGGSIANWFGRRLINPVFTWLDKKDQGYTLKQALKDGKNNKNDRRIEFLDAILHLDDVPTALALAGVQIFMPFIPLFFAMSGYRTGIGYRNLEGIGHGHTHKTKKRMASQTPTPAPKKEVLSPKRPEKTRFTPLPQPTPIRTQTPNWAQPQVTWPARPSFTPTTYGYGYQWPVQNNYHQQPRYYAPQPFYTQPAPQWATRQRRYY